MLVKNVLRALSAGLALMVGGMMVLGCGGDLNYGGNDDGNPHTHEWGAWQVTTSATCTAAGVETRRCQTDNTHTETRALAQLTGSQCAGGSLNCAAGEAWVDSYPVGERDGFVLQANGTLLWISDYSGYWEVNATGTWSTSGNSLTLTIPGEGTFTYTYTLSGSTLKLTVSGSTYTYTKITGVNIGNSHTHTWGAWQVTTPATCSAAGVETRTCQTDNTHKETRTLAQLTGSQCNSGYTVTVTGGVMYYFNYDQMTMGDVIASGSRVAPGTYVAVISDAPPANQVFSHWSYTPTTLEVTLTNVDRIVVIKMPQANVTITANFKQAAAVNTFTDSRDGKIYRMVTIGTQTWMAENLNYATTNSWCYGGDNANCVKYGRLYTWQAAKTACPSGWHLPSRAEWTTLVNYAGGSSTAGKKLKSKTGWNSGGNGTDEFGFSALPGGLRNTDGVFLNAGNYGFWWSATESGDGSAWSWRMNYDNDDVYEYSNYNKGFGWSARCVRD